MAHILCNALVDVKIIFGMNNKNKVLGQNWVCEGWMRKCLIFWCGKGAPPVGLRFFKKRSDDIG